MRYGGVEPPEENDIISPEITTLIFKSPVGDYELTRSSLPDKTDKDGNPRYSYTHFNNEIGLEDLSFRYFEVAYEEIPKGKIIDNGSYGVIKEEDVIKHSGWRLSTAGPLGEEIYNNLPELDTESEMGYYMPDGPTLAGKNLGKVYALYVSTVGRYSEIAGDYNNAGNDILVLSETGWQIVPETVNS